MTNAPRVIGRKDEDDDTKTIKEMVIEALKQAGGVSYLLERAKENPQQFLMLVGKVLPMQVAGDAGSFEVQSVNYADQVPHKTMALADEDTED